MTKSSPLREEVKPGDTVSLSDLTTFFRKFGVERPGLQTIFGGGVETFQEAFPNAQITEDKYGRQTGFFVPKQTNAK